MKCWLCAGLKAKSFVWCSSFKPYQTTSWCSSFKPYQTTSCRSVLLTFFCAQESRGDQISLVVVFVQLLSRVRLFAIPWVATHQASLSFTISWSLVKLIFIESVMSSSHLILCRALLLLPSIFISIRVFLMSRLFVSGGQSIGASASVLPKNLHFWQVL